MAATPLLISQFYTFRKMILEYGNDYNIFPGFQKILDGFEKIFFHMGRGELQAAVLVYADFKKTLVTCCNGKDFVGIFAVYAQRILDNDHYEDICKKYGNSYYNQASKFLEFYKTIRIQDVAPDQASLMKIRKEAREGRIPAADKIEGLYKLTGILDRLITQYQLDEYLKPLLDQQYPCLQLNHIQKLTKRLADLDNFPNLLYLNSNVLKKLNHILGHEKLHELLNILLDCDYLELGDGIYYHLDFIMNSAEQDREKFFSFAYEILMRIESHKNTQRLLRQKTYKKFYADLDVISRTMGIDSGSQFIFTILDNEMLLVKFDMLVNFVTNTTTANKSFSEYFLTLVLKKSVQQEILPSDKSITYLHKMVEQLGHQMAKITCETILSTAEDSHIAYFIKAAAQLGEKHATEIRQLIGIVYQTSEFKQAFQSVALFDLLAEAFVTLGPDLCGALSTAIARNHVLVSNIHHLLSTAIQFGKEYVVQLTELLSEDCAWETTKQKIDDLKGMVHHKLFPERPVDEVFADFFNLSDMVQFPISEAVLNAVKAQYKLVEQYEKKLAAMSDADLQTLTAHYSAQLKEKSSRSEEKYEVKEGDVADPKYFILAAIRETVKRVYKIFPYLEQVITILILLNDPDQRILNRMLMGQGKSPTIAYLIAYLALSGRSIDIIALSDDYAIRDAKKFKLLFERLGLTSGYLSGDYQSVSHFSPQIIYGTNQYFQNSYLREKAQGIKSRGDRPFDVVVVDEVDNLFIDNKNAKMVVSNRPTNSDIYSPVVYQAIWAYMTDEKREKSFDALQHHLHQKFNKVTFKRELIVRWFYSANSAQKMQEGRDYVVIEGAICPADYQHTGEVSRGREYSDGMHCFLQAKHSLRIQPESLATASMSQFEYFNLYKSIYGLTGTLGDKSDRNELKQLYGVSSFDTPSHHPSRRTAAEHIVSENNKKRDEALCRLVKQMVEQGRPMLILCLTIADSIRIHELVKNLSDCVLLYNGIQKESQDELLPLAGNPGAVMVATLKAGRQADIITTPLADQNGGLRVTLLFKLMTYRDELQAFARAGRQGKPGDYHYLLTLADFPDQLEEKTANERVHAWQRARNQQYAKDSEIRISHSDIFHLEYKLQELFFRLPEHIKERYLESWSLYYSELSRRVGIILARNKMTVPLLNEAEVSLWLLILEFWNRSGIGKVLLDNDAKNPAIDKAMNPTVLQFKRGKFSLTHYLIDRLANTPRLSELFSHYNNLRILQKIASKFNHDDLTRLLDNIMQEKLFMQAIPGILKFIECVGPENIDLIKYVNSHCIANTKIREQFRYARTFFILADVVINIGPQQLRMMIDLVMSQEKFSEYFIDIIGFCSQFDSENISELFALITTEPEWKSLKEKMKSLILENHRKKFPERAIDEVLADFSLPKDQLQILKEQYATIKGYEEKLPELSDGMLTQALNNNAGILRKDPTNKSNNLLLLAMIREKYKRTFKVFPYNVQMLNVLAFLNDKNAKSLARMESNDDRAVVIALLAVFLVYAGQKIDIVVKSTELADELSEKFILFYVSMNISADSISIDNPTAQQFHEDILYGTPEGFEKQYVEELAGYFPVRSRRPLDVVLIDQVDFLLSRTTNNSENLTEVYDTSDLYNFNVYTAIWKYISSQGATNVTGLHIHLAHQFPNVRFDADMVLSWFNAAKRAKSYTLGKEYKISNDEIVLSNFTYSISNTLSNRLDCGLQTFLEFKHNLSLIKESLLKAFISHTEYFKKYKMMFGVASNLGHALDCQRLNQQFQLSIYVSPSFRTASRTRHETIYVHGLQNRFAALLKVLHEMIAKGRPVLILTESLDASSQLEDLLKDECDNIYNYDVAIESDKSSLLADAGEPGAVTIATYHSEKEIKLNILRQSHINGGLHVVVTFFPRSHFDENHAFLQCEQNVEPSSCQTIACVRETVPINNPDALLKHLNQSSAYEAKIFSGGVIAKDAKLHLLFILQDVFIVLPYEMRLAHARAWSEFFTLASKYVMNNIDNADISTIEKKLCYLLIRFWEEAKFDQIFTVKNTSILHHLINYHVIELSKLLIKHHPELTRVENEKKETPAVKGRKIKELAETFEQLDAKKKKPETLVVQPVVTTSALGLEAKEVLATRGPASLTQIPTTADAKSESSTLAPASAMPTTLNFFAPKAEEVVVKTAEEKLADVFKARLPKITAACSLKNKFEWFENCLNTFKENNEKLGFLNYCGENIKKNLLGVFNSYKLAYLAKYSVGSEVTPKMI